MCTRTLHDDTFGVSCGEAYIQAIVYKSGYGDSTPNAFTVDNTKSGGGMGPMTPSSAAITYSVWDGDWAILEEYDSSGALVEKYLQGYHGLVKTFQTVAYYYQGELGSTSHIADASGALLEYYKYDLYGKPTYWSPSNSQLPSSNYGVADLGNGGARWIPELGLYDDRNRFMSPDLGRFLQPDPIGFKGDASNLYRYCGNDWANRTDPMGLEFIDQGESFSQYSLPTAYGYTEPRLQMTEVSFTRDGTGVQAHVKDFNLTVRSVIGRKIECVKNGKLVWLDRDPKNIDRTSKHEHEHREHHRQWYNQNHDKFLKDLNNGGSYKDEKSAEKAAREKLQKAFEDFNNKEHNHLPPNWNNFKPVDECAQQRQTQATQIEPQTQKSDADWMGTPSLADDPFGMTQFKQR